MNLKTACLKTWIVVLFKKPLSLAIVICPSLDLIVKHKLASMSTDMLQLV